MLLRNDSLDTIIGAKNEVTGYKTVFVSNAVIAQLNTQPRLCKQWLIYDLMESGSAVVGLSEIAYNWLTMTDTNVKCEILDVRLPCGNLAKFSSERVSFVCTQCGQPWRTKSTPSACADEANKWEEIRALGGADWNYFQDYD